jgi:murein DD-endopeptidase MepM/ murein hydrolase activator NlpD
MLLKLLSFLFASSATVLPTTLSVYPEVIVQGDPIIIVVSTTTPQTITFNNKKIFTNKYKNNIVAFVGTDINQKIGEYDVVAGDLKKTITINPRPKIEEKMSIPKKLGGDTKESEKVLMKTMAVEADTLRNLISTTTQLWKGKFIYPVKDPFVTDTYGYSRMTVGSVITHKGTDFRAPIGTEVLAMNDGIVRLVTDSRNYGKHIVIDHGNNIFTIYMHLSEFKVIQGQLIKRGDVIAFSGDTGYVHGAHLHLSIKIGTLSIDPLVFMNFFK